MGSLAVRSTRAAFDRVPQRLRTLEETAPDADGAAIAAASPPSAPSVGRGGFVRFETISPLQLTSAQAELSVMAEVLVVDDEPDIRTVMRLALERDGHCVAETATAAGAIATVAFQHVDLVLLDIELPDRSGLEVLPDLTERSEVPIILVSGRTRVADRVLGLRMGADDYITKPFSVHELTARVAATLRRTAPVTAAADVVFDGLVLRPAERELVVDGDHVHVTAKEFALLLHLARSPLRVFTRQELLREVWHSKSDWQDPATVTEHVRRLRKKVEADPDHPRWLQTVRGAGYRFVP